LNYKNVLRSIERITSSHGLGMSPKRITVSTAGVAKPIKQLGDDKVKFKLALSLHAATDAKRHEIMPINDSNNIKSLVDAMNYFYKQTENEITFEYILFKNFNDSLKDADDLIKLYRQVPADLVNIIEYNPIEFAKFEKPDEEKVEAFMAYLEKNKVNARLAEVEAKILMLLAGSWQIKKKITPEISGVFMIHSICLIRPDNFSCLHFISNAYTIEQYRMMHTGEVGDAYSPLLTATLFADIVCPRLFNISTIAVPFCADSIFIPKEP